ncbi:hypothetical protein [Halomonas chromatireducens]|uniref:Uncharacterized protein n=1 Tax=Halomonas chromatireducens TaxID=507626 RepID=A0A0X8HFW7_9GAMM|nr:hypothetical protein [Halomonas chromatireducens]AMD01888.1 hypothetical protein LOKO_02837 [Halomonas chromatireducens]
MAWQDATTTCQTLPFAVWLRHGLFTLLCLVLLLVANGAAAHATASSEIHHDVVGHAHDTTPTATFVADPHRGPHCHPGHVPLAPHPLLRTERQETEHGVALCSLARLAPPPAVLVVSGTPHGRPDSSAPPTYLLTQRLRH